MCAQRCSCSGGMIPKKVYTVFLEWKVSFFLQYHKLSQVVRTSHEYGIHIKDSNETMVPFGGSKLETSDSFYTPDQQLWTTTKLGGRGKGEAMDQRPEEELHLENRRQREGSSRRHVILRNFGGLKKFGPRRSMCYATTRRCGLVGLEVDLAEVCQCVGRF